MSNTPHTLADEFPGQMDAIHKLKVSNAEFAKLLEQYDRVNDQVHLAETKIEPIEDLSEVELRKRRLQIKDEIARALADAP
ncbi:YdcH family protein [Bosea sp. (in: a-proteobacteria)]|uniref:YdcH family protein n=1 Tax=Bosea sp. (in: a-proteobacteria) TaxID=1871050 RepID=UPI0033408930